MNEMNLWNEKGNYIEIENRIKDYLTNNICEFVKKLENMKMEVDMTKLKKCTVSKQSCTICLETFKKNSVVLELNCHHYFHKRCINRWFDENINCPTCRKNQQVHFFSME